MVTLNYPLPANLTTDDYTGEGRKLKQKPFQESQQGSKGDPMLEVQKSNKSSIEGREDYHYKTNKLLPKEMMYRGHALGPNLSPVEKTCLWCFELGCTQTYVCGYRMSRVIRKPTYCMCEIKGGKSAAGNWINIK